MSANNTITLIPPGVTFPPLNQTPSKPLSNLDKGLVIGGIILGLIILFGISTWIYSLFKDYKTDVIQNKEPGQEPKQTFAAYTIQRVTSKRQRPGLDNQATFVTPEEIQVRNEYRQGAIPSPSQVTSGIYDQESPRPVSAQSIDAIEPQILILKHQFSNGDVQLTSNPLPLPVFVPEQSLNGIVGDYGKERGAGRPVSGQYQTPVLNHRLSSEHQTPVLNHRLSGQYQTPVLNHRLSGGDRPVSAEYQTPVLNHRLSGDRPVSGEYQIPVINQRGSNANMQQLRPVQSIPQRPISMQSQNIDNRPPPPEKDRPYSTSYAYSSQGYQGERRRSDIADAVRK